MTLVYLGRFAIVSFHIHAAPSCRGDFLSFGDTSLPRLLRSTAKAGFQAYGHRCSEGEQRSHVQQSYVPFLNSSANLSHIFVGFPF